ncbi:O-methyltransferase [Gottschalkiaceae bacterium SANA]|nr:O-methyltransferase [Gottschalkiaceae bacterium SANA]
MENFHWIKDDNKRLMMQELYNKAKADRVPIILDDAARMIDSWLLLLKPTRILEVGAAVGYSAIRMALVSPISKIDTIEKDLDRAKEARENIQHFDLCEQIFLHQGDALELIPEMTQEYDLVFIDAAKGQYGRFFEDAMKLLGPGGVIICDNMLFHGFVEAEEVPKRYRAMIKKLRAFHETLMKHPELETRILSIDDGISISVKRG